jgi:hypothetical protein
MYLICFIPVRQVFLVLIITSALTHSTN